MGRYLMHPVENRSPFSVTLGASQVIKGDST